MRAIRPHHGIATSVAQSVALPAEKCWPGKPEAAGGDFDLHGGDRLSWPTAIAVTACLSAGLWLGILWLARLAFG